MPTQKQITLKKGDLVAMRNTIYLGNVQVAENTVLEIVDVDQNGSLDFGWGFHANGNHVRTATPMEIINWRLGTK